MRPFQAQLRAQIYNLLENDQDENPAPQATPSKLIDSLDSSQATEDDNRTFKKESNQEKLNLLKSDDCSLALYIIEDFFDSFNLNFTKSVFHSEIGRLANKKYHKKPKEEVLNELNLMQCGTYNCNDANENDNESSLNSSSSTKKFNKNHPILLQLLNSKFSPNNSDIIGEHKINVTYSGNNEN